MRILFAPPSLQLQSSANTIAALSTASPTSPTTQAAAVPPSLSAAATTATTTTAAPPTPRLLRRLGHIYQLCIHNLSHISTTTCVGIVLSLKALIATIYFAIPAMRLAICTAINDFRESCRNDRDDGKEIASRM